MWFICWPHGSYELGPLFIGQLELLQSCGNVVNHQAHVISATFWLKVEVSPRLGGCKFELLRCLIHLATFDLESKDFFSYHY